MTTTDTDSGLLVVNTFGLGVGDAWQPFWGSDFFMPAAWIASGYPGSRPGHAEPGTRFCLLGDGIIHDRLLTRRVRCSRSSGPVADKSRSTQHPALVRYRQ